MANDHRITSLAKRLQSAQRITVLTGAGVSAASGVPTFRGATGLWKQYRPEQLATPEAFGRDPRLIWEWYDWRRQQVARVRPNRGHDVLAAWSQQGEGFTLITQNVDGLHERAGTRDVIRFHGSIWELRCWNQCATSPPYWRDETVPLPNMPPHCPDCCGLARPGVVWFGEAVDQTVVEQSVSATACDIFITIGTSAVVYPAAALVDKAIHHGAYTVEINLDSTPASRIVDLILQGPAEVILNKIEEALGKLVPPASSAKSLRQLRQ